MAVCVRETSASQIVETIWKINLDRKHCHGHVVAALLVDSLSELIVLMTGPIALYAQNFDLI